MGISFCQYLSKHVGLAYRQLVGREFIVKYKRSSENVSFTLAQDF